MTAAKPFTFYLKAIDARKCFRLGSLFQARVDFRQKVLTCHEWVIGYGLDE